MDKREKGGPKMFWYESCQGEAELCPSFPSDGWSDNLDDLRKKREYGELWRFPRWEDAAASGIISGRAGYLKLLREVCIGIAILDLKENTDEDEAALIHLVRILDEADRSLSRLSERIEDYYIALHPVELQTGKRNIPCLIDRIAKQPDHPLSHLAKNMQRLQESRTMIARDVRVCAEKTLPNMSALCGPLVAARLLAKAGSKQHLAVMPASSLQVFGAGPSLFTHLTAGTNPPKHGIIFQNKLVHQARRKRRGRVGRVLACQLAIAARIDYFRGKRDESFLKKAGERLCRAG